MSNTKFIFSLILIVLVLVIATTQSGWLKARGSTEVSQPGLYKVSSFVDGDTIVVDMSGHQETIRFIGVDTPETHKPNTPVQCYGPDAAAFTKNLIGYNRVRLQADPLDTNRDRYNRLLRYIYLSDGRLVEEEIIKNGYGFAYTSFPFEKKQHFIELETIARQSRVGLWGACQPTLTSYGSYQSNPL